MGTVRADRLWAIGGALGAVVLLALAWFFFISPRNSEISSLHDQARAAQGRLKPLQARLVELRQQNAELPQYLAQLERDRRALPATSGMSDFLRGLQAAGDNAGVSVSGLVVGAPVQVSAAGKQVHALPVNVTAEGGAGKLNQFVEQLQQVQPRAVLITNMGISVSASVSGAFTLTLTMQVFVAPPSGAAAAAPKGK